MDRSKQYSERVGAAAFLGFLVALLVALLVDVSHGAVSSSPITVANVAALKALAPGAYPEVSLGSYYSSVYGGGGPVYWSATSTATPDSCTVYKPSSNPTRGRWLRRLVPPLNAKQCGAYGNDTANDNAAIQAAVNYLYAQGGGDLYVPQGNYRLTTVIKNWAAPLSINIYGDGEAATVFKKKDSSATALFDFSSNVGVLETYSKFSQFKITGTLKGHDGIKLTRMAYCQLDRLYITNCSNAVNNIGSLVNEIDHCKFHANTNGFLARKSGTVYSNLINFYATKFTGNTGWGIDFGQGSGLFLKGCDIESNGTAGDTTTGAVMIRNTTDDEIGFGSVAILSTWFESNKGYTITAEDGGGAFISLRDLLFIGNENTGFSRAIHMGAARSVVIDNCFGGSPGDTWTFTSNVTKTDIRNSTINILQDSCQNRNHFNLTGNSGLAGGFSTDLFLSSLARLRVAVDNSFGHEHAIYNDTAGSLNRLRFDSYNAKGFYFSGGVAQFGDSLAVASNFTVGTNKLTVAGATGNTVVAGTVQSGPMRVGGAPGTAQGITIDGVSLTSVNPIGMVIQPAFPSTATTGPIGLDIQFRTAAAAFTATTGRAVRIEGPSLGAGSAVTTMIGIDIDNQTVGTTNRAIRTGTGAVILGDSVTVAGGTAVTAGGASRGLYFGSTAAIGIYFGSGAPTISAGKGSLYLRTDGTGATDRAYINTNGSTTWTNIVTAL